MTTLIKWMRFLSVTGGVWGPVWVWCTSPPVSLELSHWMWMGGLTLLVMGDLLSLAVVMGRVYYSPYRLIDWWLLGVPFFLLAQWAAASADQPQKYRMVLWWADLVDQYPQVFGLLCQGKVKEAMSVCKHAEEALYHIVDEATKKKLHGVELYHQAVTFGVEEQVFALLKAGRLEDAKHRALAARWAFVVEKGDGAGSASPTVHDRELCITWIRQRLEQAPRSVQKDEVIQSLGLALIRATTVGELRRVSYAIEERINQLLW